VGLATIFHCLRLETSLFVASYDSQGHGGNIRPRLLKGFNQSVLEFMNALSFITSGEPNIDHHLEQLVILLSLSRECVFGEPFPGKWTSASVRCYSGSQTVITEALPNKWSYSSRYVQRNSCLGSRPSCLPVCFISSSVCPRITVVRQGWKFQRSVKSAEIKLSYCTRNKFKTLRAVD
jgi:hypothetical protein